MPACLTLPLFVKLFLSYMLCCCLSVVFLTGLIDTAVSTAAHQCTTIPANCFVYTFKYNLCSTPIPIDGSTRVSQYLKFLVCYTVERRVLLILLRY